MARTKKRPKIKEIRDLATIKVLTESTRLAIMEGLGEGRSVTQLADELELPRTRLYHHMKVLEEHQLIRIKETRKVGAIEEKIYECAADAFKLAPEVNHGEQIVEEVDAMGTVVFDTSKADLRRAAVKGFEDEGEDFRNRVGIGRHLGRMTNDRAAAMMDEIREIIDRYLEVEEGEDEHAYAFVWALYPTSATLT